MSNNEINDTQSHLELIEPSLADAIKLIKDDAQLFLEGPHRKQVQNLIDSLDAFAELRNKEYKIFLASIEAIRRNIEFFSPQLLAASEIDEDEVVENDFQTENNSYAANAYQKGSQYNMGDDSHSSTIDLYNGMIDPRSKAYEAIIHTAESKPPKLTLEELSDLFKEITN